MMKRVQSLIQPLRKPTGLTVGKLRALASHRYDETSIQVNAANEVTAWNDLVGSAHFDTIVGSSSKLKPHYSDSVRLLGDIGDYVSTPITAGRNIAGGDMTVMACIRLDEWGNSNNDCIACQWGASGNWSWTFRHSTASQLAVLISGDGSSFLSRVSTDTITPSGNLWVIFQLNTTTNQFRFYTASNDYDDPPIDPADWVQLGDFVSHTGTAYTGSTANINIGAEGSGGATARMIGSAFRVLGFDSLDTSGTPNFDYPNDDIWTYNGNAQVQNTGHTVISAYKPGGDGDVGLETTTPVDIVPPFTVIALARYSENPITTSQTLFDARSLTTKRAFVYGRVSTLRYEISQGTVIDTGLAVDYDPHVYTAKFFGDENTGLIISGVGSGGGDAGPDTWDMGSIMTLTSGFFWMSGYIGELMVIEEELTDEYLAAAANVMVGEYNL